MKTATLTHTVIVSAASASEIASIQKLRYAVYAIEMKLDLPGMDHARQIFADSLDNGGIHLFAAADSRIVGAVRLNINEMPSVVERPMDAQSLPRPFVYCSRLNILSEYRGSGVVDGLISAAFGSFHEHGAAVAVCHCYPHLLKLYRRHGFRPYASRFTMPGLEHLGEQIPLQLYLTGNQTAQAA